MSNEQISTIIAVAVVALALYTLVKLGVKIAISLVVILLVFKMGFMMTGTDLNETFKVDQFLKPGAATAVIDFFDKWREEGNKIAVVDQEKVYDAMVDGIEKTFVATKDILSNIDFDQLITDLSDAINKSDVEEISESETRALLEKKFPDMTSVEIDVLYDDLVEKLDPSIEVKK